MTRDQHILTWLGLVGGIFTIPEFISHKGNDCVYFSRGAQLCGESGKIGLGLFAFAFLVMFFYGVLRYLKDRKAKE
jgi:hypothetical protein